MCHRFTHLPKCSRLRCPRISKKIQTVTSRSSKPWPEEGGQRSVWEWLPSENLHHLGASWVGKPQTHLLGRGQRLMKASFLLCFSGDFLCVCTHKQKFWLYHSHNETPLAKHLLCSPRQAAPQQRSSPTYGSRSTRSNQHVMERSSSTGWGLVFRALCLQERDLFSLRREKCPREAVFLPSIKGSTNIHTVLGCLTSNGERIKVLVSVAALHISFWQDENITHCFCLYKRYLAFSAPKLVCCAAYFFCW